MSKKNNYLFRISLATLLTVLAVFLFFIPLNGGTPTQTKQATAEFKRYIPIEGAADGKTLGYSATYRFTTDRGEEIDAEESAVSEWTGALKPHDKLTIYYNPENPHDTSIKTTSSLVFVGVFLLMPAAVIFLSIPKKRSN